MLVVRRQYQLSVRSIGGKEAHLNLIFEKNGSITFSSLARKGTPEVAAGLAMLEQFADDMDECGIPHRGYERPTPDGPRSQGCWVQALCTVEAQEAASRERSSLEARVGEMQKHYKRLHPRAQQELE